MVIAIGKYTESYKSLFNKDGFNLAPDGYVWRLADEEIDETCFEQGGQVFTDTTELLESIVQALDYVVDGVNYDDIPRTHTLEALGYAYAATQALLCVEKHSFDKLPYDPTAFLL